MDKKELLRFKAGLLCLGVRVDGEARAKLAEEYPNFFDRGFIDAANMNVCGSNICVSAGESFTKNSPYELFYGESGFYVKNGAENVPVRFFGELPKTGTFLDDMARLHSDRCVNIWPSTACCFDAPGKKCAFCSLQKEKSAPVPPDELAYSLKILLSKCACDLNFSGGTYISPDDMARYWCEVVKKIRAFSDCPIAVELAPPDDLSLLDSLCEAGLDAVIMNLEIADETLRKRICPGKSSISKAHYYAAYERASALFGRGMVSCVLIAGLQPKEDIVRECEELAKRGVYPTIMPFRPMDDCALRGTPPCDPDELLEMSLILGEILRVYGLEPDIQPGCTRCGGCSLENECRTFAAEKIIR